VHCQFAAGRPFPRNFRVFPVVLGSIWIDETFSMQMVAQKPQRDDQGGLESKLEV